jgi:hypothetical protein
MRGDHEHQAPIWSYISPEQRVPADHPLRPPRALVDAVLKDLSPRLSRLYAKTGRPSVAPERLLRASGCRSRSHSPKSEHTTS